MVELITRALLAAVAATFCGWLPVSTTSVGTGLICQPTYLGNASGPDRIPLSPVIYNSNHGYGSHSVIFESRPCFHGHFITDTRPEYEQNLAVLFGISCKLSDETQMVDCVATLSVRKALPPKNAPYTQEQVLAASLQTLLMYSPHMSKDRPLTVEIKGDGIPQPKWAAKYAKRFYYTDEYLERLRKDPEWKDGTSCKFTLDPKSMKLLRGSVPGYKMEWGWGRIRVATAFPEQDEPAAGS